MKTIHLALAALVVGIAGYWFGKTSVKDPGQDANPPYVYSTGWGERSEIREVNRSTGEEKVLYAASEAESKDTIRYSVVAVPQIGYDGRIFVRRGLETPSGELHEFDAASRQMKKLDVPYWPLGDLTSNSPDQTHAAFITTAGLEAGPGWNVVVYGYLTGETKTLGQAGAGEYFAESVGGDTFGGSEGGEIYWTDHRCFTVSVYEDPDSDEDLSHKKFKESRKFCLP